jgi:hypothetical protein
MKTVPRRQNPRGPVCSAGRSARRPSPNASANPRPSSSIPSLARWLASPAAAARCEWRVPPRLEGRGVLRGAGKLVLTYGEGGEATGHSAGVGEGGRRGFSARRKKTAARRHRSRGSRRARRCRVRLLPTGGSGLRGERRSLRQPPIPPPPTPPSPPLFPSPAAVWTGEDSPPRRLGLGEPRRLRCSYL